MTKFLRNTPRNHKIFDFWLLSKLLGTEINTRKRCRILHGSGKSQALAYCQGLSLRIRMQIWVTVLLQLHRNIPEFCLRTRKRREWRRVQGVERSRQKKGRRKQHHVFAATATALWDKSYRWWTDCLKVKSHSDSASRASRPVCAVITGKKNFKVVVCRK